MLRTLVTYKGLPRRVTFDSENVNTDAMKEAWLERFSDIRMRAPAMFLVFDKDFETYREIEPTDALRDLARVEIVDKHQFGTPAQLSNPSPSAPSQASSRIGEGVRPPDRPCPEATGAGPPRQPTDSCQPICPSSQRGALESGGREFNSRPSSAGSDSPVSSVSSSSCPADRPIASPGGPSGLSGSSSGDSPAISSTPSPPAPQPGPQRRRQDTELHRAAKCGKFEMVQTLVLERRIDVNAQNENGWTPLKLASLVGRDSIVQFLLEHGADASIADDEGYQPLFNAVSRLHRNDTAREAVLRTLVDHGAPLNAVALDGTTPLIAAINTHREDVVQLLVSKGADVNQVSITGMTPLMVAANKGRCGMVDLLLKLGADPTKVDDDLDGPLHYASQKGASVGSTCAKIITLLLDAGADPKGKNKKGLSPMHMTAAADNEEATMVFIAAGALVDEKNSDGEAPLDFATSSLRARMITKAVEMGQDVRATSPPTSRFIVKRADDEVIKGLAEGVLKRRVTIHVAAQLGHVQMAARFIREGTDVNLQDDDGWTPLKLAARKGDEEMCRFLLENGADPNLADNESFTALHNACGNLFKKRPQDRSIVKLLVDHGARLDSPTPDGRTPLMMAASLWCLETTKMLIARAASPTMADREGDTALHHVCRAESEPTRDFNQLLEIIVALLDSGANVNAQNDNGYTPLHWTVHRRHLAASRLLVQRGAKVDITDELGRTPVFLAWQDPLEQAVLIREGEEAGQHVPHKLSMLEKILCFAASRGDVYTAAYCLDSGVDIRTHMVQGVSALNAAACKLQREMVELLCSRGADANVVDKDGDTPLLNVARQAKDLDEEGLEIVRILLRYGANVNIQNKRGYTALHWAAHADNEELCMMLIEAGADVSIMDEEYRTPFVLASAELLGKLVAKAKAVGSPATDESVSNSLLAVLLRSLEQSNGGTKDLMQLDMDRSPSTSSSQSSGSAPGRQLSPGHAIPHNQSTEGSQSAHNQSQPSSSAPHARVHDHLREELTCAVCQELLQDPQQLKCLHNFCRRCLGAMCTMETDGMIALGRLRCPTCRVESKRTEVRANFTLNNIVEFLQNSSPPASTSSGGGPSSASSSCSTSSSSGPPPQNSSPTITSSIPSSALATSLTNPLLIPR